ncbi:E2F-associated phospho protein-domain-containing protein [Ostreococcus tauri]|uniref:E2F-associated phospho protein-domain-containing protein n=1 Tax=Ostreococcus tauri TaxID=70448 RepID=A0A1Y5IMN5_OSTTA|nr:E2F-associated phospho protein-domain-containing protein [Ostreococcus tauri]
MSTLARAESASTPDEDVPMTSSSVSGSAAVGAYEARELYDANADAREAKAFRRALGLDAVGDDARTDAVLSCVGCFATICALCQKHERHEQYRAVFAAGVRTETEVAWRPSEATDASERYREVKCEECGTTVGVMDDDDVYHFFNVLASAG